MIIHTKKSTHILKNLLLLSYCFISLSCQFNTKRKHQKAIAVEYQKKRPDGLNEPVKSFKKGIKIATWNIQNLGKSKDAEELEIIAEILKDFDLIAIQEVVAKDPKGAQAVAKIVDNLNRKGFSWDYSISNPTKSPSSNMSERYAFIWKKSKINIVYKPYLDSNLEDVVIREPFIGEFKIKNKKESLILVNFHSRVHSQNPEEEIVFFEKYPDRLKNNKVIILGDFNLNEQHTVWNALYQKGFKPAIQKTPTTLKRKCTNNRYLNHSIDNIYYNSKYINLYDSGRIDFVKSCSNLTEARQISDHLPVYVELSFK